MMQRYGRAFARVYDKFWNGFSRGFAPVIHGFVGEPADKSLLDLCCGTGQFARYFLERDWTVTGLDLSRDMLALADERNADYGESGRWTALRGDARQFSLPSSFCLVTSLFDALNHLDSEADLASCFASVFAALGDTGSFIFDLNTRKGLRDWTCFEVEEEDELFVVKRGLFVEETAKAWLSLSGFSRTGSGSWERFKETFYNSYFATDRVLALLKRAGFRSVELRRGDSSFAPATDPEGEERLFFVATK
jgi:SAM-dependent methyltransferase